MNETSRHRTRLCLLGASLDTGNLGVSALAESSVKAVLSRWPDADLTLLGGGRADEEYDLTISGRQVRVKKLAIRFGKNLFLPNHLWVLFACGVLLRLFRGRRLRQILAARNQCIKTITQAHLVVDIAGGDSFSDIYGMRRFFWACSRQYLIKLFRKPLILLPQTYGPFNRRISRILARPILKYAAAVYSRDKDGIGYVQKLIGSKNGEAKAKFMPDIGFILDPVKPDEGAIQYIEETKSRGNILVGLNISGLLFNGGYTRNNMFNLKADYPQLVNSIIDMLLGYDKTRVLLVPHVFPPPGFEISSDLIVCRKVYEQNKARHTDRILLAGREYDCKQAKYLIGLCDFFIGSRMHSCIAALSQCIPSMGLAYSRKFAGVFGSIGVGDLVVDLRLFEKKRVLQRIDTAFQRRDILRERLKEIIPGVRVHLSNLFDEVESDVKCVR